jgi:hypothetical protein
VNNIHGGQTLVVVDYQDMGQDYVKDILPLADNVKARRQKTMISNEIMEFLNLAGKSDITVRNLSWYKTRREADACHALVMNNHERRYIEALDCRKQIEYTAGRRGEGAWLYRLER